ncbi:hypothetical protein [Methylibium sp.]|uniref:hypothetical protein n=1 Tax=Methylibium sp. TaxID=2067992 RepID=UPI003D13AD66
MKARARRSPAAPRLWVGVLLCAALLWAQALGLAHRSVHGGVSGTVVAIAAPQAHGGTSAAAHGIEALFGHERGTPACHLYDQLSLGDAVSSGSVDAVPALSPCHLAAPVPTPPSGAVRLAYRARAPPPTIA